MACGLLQGPDDAIRVLRSQLAVGECSNSDCRFEILRATVWSIAAPCGAAHVNRVLTLATPPWRLLSGQVSNPAENARAELRSALTTLEDAGDLLELSGGFWAPAPTRLVSLPDNVGYFVVGGVPSTLLGLEAGLIHVHGPHRHLLTVPAGVRTLPVEDLTSWARLPDVPLEEWARQSIDSFERHPYAPTDVEAFDFYVPGNARPGTPQFFRWSENAAPATGTLLARRRRIYGAREYRLIDVQAGRIVRACEIPGLDARRLMYAFDRRAGNPVKATVVRTVPHTEVVLTTELPRAERRAFAAFGTLSIPADRRYERRWTLVRNVDVALEMLRALSIALERSHQEAR